MDMMTTIIAAMGLPQKPRTLIAVGFALLIAVVCALSLVAMFVLRMKEPAADVAAFQAVFLATLGYVAGILTGLLGLKD
jgi:hypothetical protein